MSIDRRKFLQVAGLTVAGFFTGVGSLPRPLHRVSLVLRIWECLLMSAAASDV